MLCASLLTVPSFQAFQQGSTSTGQKGLPRISRTRWACTEYGTQVTPPTSLGYFAPGGPPTPRGVANIQLTFLAAWNATGAAAKAAAHSGHAPALPMALNAASRT